MPKSHACILHSDQRQFCETVLALGTVYGESCASSDNFEHKAVYIFRLKGKSQCPTRGPDKGS